MIFDNKGKEYLLPEFGAKVLELADTLKPGDGYTVINKTNCGNGGTEALLGLDMRKYPDTYLFIISHSKAGVKGKEDEGNHSHVVFLHQDKKNKFGIERKKRHYMCTPEAIYKRFDSLKDVSKGKRVIFIFDEIHKSVLDRSFRVTRFLIGHSIAISIGLTATPHLGQYHRIGMVVKGLPKKNRGDFVWTVKDPIKCTLVLAQDNIGKFKKEDVNIIVAFHDTSPILKMLQLAYDYDMKVYVETGSTVTPVVKATQIYDEVVTEDVHEADFFLGTQSIVDSLSFFHKTAKDVLAIICRDSGQVEEEDSNKTKGFTDADTFQLPFRFRNATDFTLIKVEKDEDEKKKYSHTLTKDLHDYCKVKHFVGKKQEEKSGNVLYSVRSENNHHLDAMDVGEVDHVLEAAGAHIIKKDELLEEVLRNKPPKDVNFTNPYNFKELSHCPLIPEELNMPKAFIDPDLYHDEDIEGNNFKEVFKSISQHITLPRKNTHSNIYSEEWRAFYWYIYCRIFTGKLKTPIGDIKVDDKGKIEVPDLNVLFNKLKEKVDNRKVEYRNKFQSLLRHFHKDLTIDDFEEMRENNRIIESSQSLKKLKRLYEYEKYKRENKGAKDKEKERTKNWVMDLREPSFYETKFNMEIIEPEIKVMMEESEEYSFHDMVLSRYDSYYNESDVPVLEALNILLENEEFKYAPTTHNRQYGTLTKLSKTSRTDILDVLYGSKWKRYDCKSAALASVCYARYNIEVPQTGLYKGEGLDREISKNAAVIFTNKYFKRDSNNKWLQYFPKTNTEKDAEPYLAHMQKHLSRHFIQAHVERSHELLAHCEAKGKPPISFYNEHTRYENKIMRKFASNLRSNGFKVNRVHDEIYIFGENIPDKSSKLFEIILENKSKRKFNPFTLKSWEVDSWKDIVKNR